MFTHTERSNELMDVETIVKLVGAIVAILGIWKILYEFKTGRKAHLRAEYEFAKKFLSEIDSQNIHPFPLEKGYQAIAGTNTVKASEVEYILTLEDPVQCLKDYVLSKQLMDKMDTTGDLKLSFRKKYSKRWSRRWRKVMYISFYFAFAIIAFCPLLIQSHFNTSLSNMAIQLIFSIPLGGLYAWGALNAYSKIIRGEHLIENQSKHTQRVIVATSNSVNYETSVPDAEKPYRLLRR